MPLEARAPEEWEVHSEWVDRFPETDEGIAAWIHWLMQTQPQTFSPTPDSGPVDLPSYQGLVERYDGNQPLTVTFRGMTFTLTTGSNYPQNLGHWEVRWSGGGTPPENILETVLRPFWEHTRSHGFLDKGADSMTMNLPRQFQGPEGLMAHIFRDTD